MQNITRIKLYSNSLFPETITGGYLDCDDKTTIPLNFAIADIRDISKKKGVFSKSINVPGTKNNHQLLNNYFDVNVQAGTFDINKIQYCSIIQDGVVILDNAIIQLVSVNKSQTNGSYEDNITYTLLVKDQTSDFFTTIGNKMLTDIDFSYLNHIYTADNVINSFDNTVNDGYKYIMPYNSLDLNTEAADAQFELNEFTPGIYAKTYFDKIFTSAGYTYNWVGITSSSIRFDKLIVPYNGDVVSAQTEDSEIYTATVQRTGTSSLYNTTTTPTSLGNNKPAIVGGAIDIVTAPTIISDPNGDYNATQSIYVTPNLPSMSNNVRYDVDIEYEIIVENPYPVSVYLKGIRNKTFSGFNSNQFEYISIYSPMKLTPSFSIRRYDGTTLTVASEIEMPFINKSNADFTAFPPGTSIMPGTTGSNTFNTTIEGLTPGQVLSLGAQLKADYGFSGYNSFYNFYKSLSPIDIFNSTIISSTEAYNTKLKLRVKNVKLKITCELSGDYGFNVPLKMNRFIPAQIKQSDFVKGILTMYNLYVEVDKENQNRLNIYSRNDYYDSGKVEDWTKKLVKEKPQELKFIPEITNKKAIITYKKDEDWANDRYLNSTNEIYGQAEFIFDNEYVKDTTTTELLFSPTPVSNTPFGAICPIWNGQGPSCNIRILYDGGAWTCGTYQINNWRNTSGAIGSYVTASVYPLVTHWDRPYNPTFDLNFLPCDFYFRSDNWGSDTNNNLFNLHWRRTFNQINSGKILTAYFMLNAVDIQKMRLNDKIRIDNSWWNINSIKDYDANSNSATKVELISIDDNTKIPFIQRNAIRLRAGSPYLSILNDLAKSKQRNYNTITSTGDVDVIGRNNTILEGFNGKIVGNNNSVLGGNGVVYGNDNYVTAPNSIVIGSSIEATQSNTLYTSNIVVSEGGTINNQPIENVVGIWSVGNDVNVAKLSDVFDTIQINPTTTASITTPEQGMIIYDSSILKIYDGSQWLEYVGLPINVSGSGAMNFDYPLIYNSPASPLTGNLTQSPSSPFMVGKQGIIQKIYHQQGTVPTFPTGWVLLRGAYSTTSLNIIYAEWVSGTRVEYWIIN